MYWKQLWRACPDVLFHEFDRCWKFLKFIYLQPLWQHLVLNCLDKFRSKTKDRLPFPKQHWCLFILPTSRRYLTEPPIPVSGSEAETRITSVPTGASSGILATYRSRVNLGELSLTSTIRMSASCSTFSDKEMRSGHFLNEIKNLRYLQNFQIFYCLIWIFEGIRHISCAQWRENAVVDLKLLRFKNNGAFEVRIPCLLNVASACSECSRMPNARMCRKRTNCFFVPQLPAVVHYWHHV